MVRKLMMTAALVGVAVLMVPTSATYAQMRQEGAGGASMNTPGAGTAQGPIVQPNRSGVRMAHPTRKRHVKRTRHMRSTVGSR